MLWIMLMVEGGWLKEDMTTVSLVARGIIMGERVFPIPGGSGGGWLALGAIPGIKEMKCMFCWGSIFSRWPVDRVFERRCY